MNEEVIQLIVEYLKQNGEVEIEPDYVSTLYNFGAFIRKVDANGEDYGRTRETLQPEIPKTQEASGQYLDS